MTEWTSQRTEIVNCRLPTHRHCRAAIFADIEKGRFGDEPLDGLRSGILVVWPGPIHKGNGVIRQAP